jgi:hypothetical protein
MGSIALYALGDVGNRIELIGTREGVTELGKLLQEYAENFSGVDGEPMGGVTVLQDWTEPDRILTMLSVAVVTDEAYARIGIEKKRR